VNIPRIQLPSTDTNLVKGWPEPITYHYAAMPAYRMYVIPDEVVPGVQENVMQKWQDKCLFVPFPPFHVSD
jgi:hypothetical protein